MILLILNGILSLDRLLVYQVEHYLPPRGFSDLRGLGTLHFSLKGVLKARHNYQMHFNIIRYPHQWFNI